MTDTGSKAQAECWTCKACYQPQGRQGNFTGFTGKHVPHFALLLSTTEATEHARLGHVVYNDSGKVSR